MGKIIRTPGGSINPEEIAQVLLKIPGVTSEDKQDLGRALHASTMEVIEKHFGDKATRYEKTCYVVAVFACMTLLALKEFCETDDDTVSANHPAFSEFAWEFQLDDTSQSVCTNCGRNRISLCMNGKHRCEKCDFSPELGRVVTDEELEGNA